ncbi:POK9 protein, partial [Machaerirhynchus nigripectus]|nr:POK9 protein [Machaerirhynchus nigripectus]
SLGVDVETAVNVTLTDTTVQRIPTTANGPLAHPPSLIGALLIGRSSATARGLIVLPGIIDADFTGQISILAYTLHPPLFIPKGSRVAQLVALMNQQPLKVEPSSNTPALPARGDGSFGSTAPAVLFTQDLTERPTQQITLSSGGQQIMLCPLLDTGADVTIIS